MKNSMFVGVSNSELCGGGQINSVTHALTKRSLQYLHTYVKYFSQKFLG